MLLASGIHLFNEIDMCDNSHYLKFLGKLTFDLNCSKKQKVADFYFFHSSTVSTVINIFYLIRVNYVFG